MLVQQITPEILQWISLQAQAGHTPEAVLGSMRASGWEEDVARFAVEQAKRGSLVEPPPAVPVPEPHFYNSPWVLQTSDREVQVLATMKHPRVIVFGNLLSDDECDALIELARPKLERSTTVDNWNGGHELTDVRTSEGTYFSRGENALLQRLETRIAELVNWPVERGEGVQILRYGVGAQYLPHHDYFDPTVPGAGALLKHGGPRVATLVMYLNMPAVGGSTIFPEVDFQVAPMRGGAVFFSYSRPHPATRTLHGGAMVLEGEKWIATKWLRSEAMT